MNLSSLIIPLTALIGLIVLMALHDITADVAVPIIVGLAGVHVGAALNTGK
jgi:hypothetical protein